MTEKKQIGTIDLTPTWSALVNIMLVSWSNGETTDMRLEFQSMARAADKWNEHCKEVNDA